MNVDLARLQFASTTHLPLPVRAGHDRPRLPRRDPADDVAPRRRSRVQRRLTRFFGTLLVINIAIGVVTGLVQEFEFGMNWSAYSRFVGDVFGAPLAMEGLAAFFLESTFLGLWLFGWDRLPKRIHLADDLAGRDRRRRCRRRSSWRPTRGCSTRSATRSTRRRAGRCSTTSARCSPTRCSCGATLHVLLASLVTGALVMLGVSGVAPAPPRRGEPVLPHGEAGARRAGAGDPARPHGRQPARRHRDDVPADEDRGRGGAVGDLPAVLVLGVPDRRRQERRDPDEDHRDPAPAVGARDRHVGRAGRRASTS